MVFHHTKSQNIQIYERSQQGVQCIAAPTPQDRIVLINHIPIGFSLFFTVWSIYIWNWQFLLRSSWISRKVRDVPFSNVNGRNTSNFVKRNTIQVSAAQNVRIVHILHLFQTRSWLNRFWTPVIVFPQFRIKLNSINPRTIKNGRTSTRYKAAPMPNSIISSVCVNWTLLIVFLRVVTLKHVCWVILSYLYLRWNHLGK